MLTGLVRWQFESGGAAFGDVLLHAIASDADAFQTVAVTQLFHQFQAALIGQSQIADDKVEFMLIREFEGLVG